ncbi:hypothetical protein [Paucihalobacter sp.]|uniref:hypothetical protein n=1 Tax=Paucihalobacter sp. TaxID=2850405 RepID=UPI003D161264
MSKLNSSDATSIQFLAFLNFGNNAIALCKTLQSGLIVTIIYDLDVRELASDLIV